MRSAWKAVTELSAGIENFSDFLRNVRNKILPDGTLDDHASPELARIRRETEKQKRQIQQSLHGYLRRLSEGRRSSGRTDHHPRRAFRHPSKG